MTWVKSFWLAFITGYWRPETQPEADLRAQVQALREELSAVKLERDTLASTLTIRETECKMLAELVERDRRRVAAETAVAAHGAAWHARGER